MGILGFFGFFNQDMWIQRHGYFVSMDKVHVDVEMYTCIHKVEQVRVHISEDQRNIQEIPAPGETFIFHGEEAPNSDGYELV